MSLSIQALVVETFVPMLGTLRHLMNRATEHAKAKQVDVATLVEARLAPDMYNLSSQIQIACYHAASAVAWLTGATPPALENVPKTFEQLIAQIDATSELVRSAPSAAFEGAAERSVELPLPSDPDGYFAWTGEQYLRDWAIPHFYFHLVTAYNILRHSGVEIGKRDYISHIVRYIRRRG